MSFNHLAHLDRFLSDHKAGNFHNDSVATVERFGVAPCFRCIGVHHLTPDENVGKRNIYLDVVDPTGKRLSERIEWGWQGMRLNETPSPVTLDKPPYEPGGNISVDWGQRIWVRVLGRDSDKVSNLTTQLKDEGIGNTLGHHSHYVVFAYSESEPVVTPPDEPPAPNGCGELQEQYDALLAAIKEVRGILDRILR